MDLKRWTEATNALPWGVQRVLTDTLNLVAEGKVTLVHSRDYENGSPCLINAVAQMLQSTSGKGGTGIPARYFGNIVVLFDSINSHFQTVPGYNNPGDHKVSPAVAEVLLHYFAPLKPKPTEADIDEATAMKAFANHVYVEPKDEDLLVDWLNCLDNKTVDEIHIDA